MRALERGPTKRSSARTVSESRKASAPRNTSRSAVPLAAATIVTITTRYAVTALPRAAPPSRLAARTIRRPAVKLSGTAIRRPTSAHQGSTPRARAMAAAAVMAPNVLPAGHDEGPTLLSSGGPSRGLGNALRISQRGPLGDVLQGRSPLGHCRLLVGRLVLVDDALAHGLVELGRGDLERVGDSR